ncbi:zinc finger TRAF-type-containing protein 1 isoform X1 [Molothrus aeneus]|uniref:zinc finger TRAF-type-containing protein 1 isoform X1 n=1 Tax=Molothrus aeneus TaxID=84833 RepID=UPI00345A54E8
MAAMSGPEERDAGGGGPAAPSAPSAAAPGAAAAAALGGGESGGAEEAAAAAALLLEAGADPDAPPKKRLRAAGSGGGGAEGAAGSVKLEERLYSVLCCTVCLDLPKASVYQCTNGHLMCAGCFIHLLADSRLKEEQATCPNCRCEISKSLCCRNLAVEKAVSELPAECGFCARQFPRSLLERHQKDECQDRSGGIWDWDFWRFYGVCRCCLVESWWFGAVPRWFGVVLGGGTAGTSRDLHWIHSSRTVRKAERIFGVFEGFLVVLGWFWVYSGRFWVVGDLKVLEIFIGAAPEGPSRWLMDGNGPGWEFSHFLGGFLGILGPVWCWWDVAVEKTVSELPAECGFCARQFPRSLLERHQKDECQDRSGGIWDWDFWRFYGVCRCCLVESRWFGVVLRWFLVVLGGGTAGTSRDLHWIHSRTSVRMGEGFYGVFEGFLVVLGWFWVYSGQCWWFWVVGHLKVLEIFGAPPEGRVPGQVRRNLGLGFLEVLWSLQVLFGGVQVVWGGSVVVWGGFGWWDSRNISRSSLDPQQNECEGG